MRKVKPRSGDEAIVVTKAVLRGADQLRDLAESVGLDYRLVGSYNLPRAGEVSLRLSEVLASRLNWLCSSFNCSNCSTRWCMETKGRQELGCQRKTQRCAAILST